MFENVGFYYFSVIVPCCLFHCTVCCRQFYLVVLWRLRLEKRMSVFKQSVEILYFQTSLFQGLPMRRKYFNQWNESFIFLKLENDGININFGEMVRSGYRVIGSWLYKVKRASTKPSFHLYSKSRYLRTICYQR